MIKRQGTIDLVRGTVKAAEEVGFMVLGKVVCHVQVLSQIMRDKHAPIGIVDMHLAGRFSTGDFHLPFLL